MKPLRRAVMGGGVEVVEHCDVVTRFTQFVDDMRTDKTGTAGDE